MELRMEINNINSIKHFEFSFPLEKGLYAITGENGSGKSTVVTCASTLFYQIPVYDYLGRSDKEASIKFEMEGSTRSWSYEENKWNQDSSSQRMRLKGFYEGSIMFGNRFKDTNSSMIHILDQVNSSEMKPAYEFVQKNMGQILHGDENYYKELFVLNKETAKKNGLSNSTYFYKALDGEYVSQARMSTGENLLVSILNSLNIVRNKRIRAKDKSPYIVFLDEIELALHPSALCRLVQFLSKISKEYDLSIFFSTHSIELIRGIKPQNIYYLTRQLDDTILITNPCYPAYATRNLYSDDGYGDDVIILVEDDVAKSIVDRILFEKDLLQNIRIKVLPTGGWTNTITMAYDVRNLGILSKSTKLALVLDRDIKQEVPSFMKKHKQYKDLEPDYLPINSLEKYLRKSLVLNVDTMLYFKLDNYVFQKRPLATVLNKYNNDVDISIDQDGKTLYGYLLNELRSMGKDRDVLVEVVVKYLLENDSDLVDDLTNYLRKKISE